MIARGAAPLAAAHVRLRCGVALSARRCRSWWRSRPAVTSGWRRVRLLAAC